MFLIVPLSPHFVFVHNHCVQNTVIWIITKLHPVLAGGYVASAPPTRLCGLLAQAVSPICIHFVVTWELKPQERAGFSVFVTLGCPWYGRQRSTEERTALAWSSQDRPVHFTYRNPALLGISTLKRVQIKHKQKKIFWTVNIQKSSSHSGACGS